MGTGEGEPDNEGREIREKGLFWLKNMLSDYPFERFIFRPIYLPVFFTSNKSDSL
jgi:hypothetical protein